MERTFENILLKSKEQAKRNREINKLRERRDDINIQIAQLQAVNEMMLCNSIIEDAEQIFLPFSKRFPAKVLTTSTNFVIDFEMNNMEIQELHERIEDFYGVDVPEETKLETFSDLVTVVEEVTDALYGDQL